MKSRTTAFLLVAFGVCAFGACTLASAQASREVDVTTTHLRGPIYMLEGNGGNVGVSIGPDGVLIIDDQYEAMAGKLRAALDDLSDAKLQFLLNTHHHFDHTGGNHIFGEEALIVAHSNVRTRLMAGKNHNKAALPVITFDDSMSLHFNGEEIRLKHYPNGHTDNDVVIHFTGSNVVHMGDLLFTTSYPSFYPANGGSILGYARNVGAVLEWLPADAQVIAGHGRLASKDDVRAFHAMLVETTGIVQERIAVGKSRDEAVAEGLPARYETWVSSFTTSARWLTNLYNDLD